MNLVQSTHFPWVICDFATELIPTEIKKPPRKPNQRNKKPHKQTKNHNTHTKKPHPNLKQTNKQTDPQPPITSSCFHFALKYPKKLIWQDLQKCIHRTDA